jgi:hypothetical protein
MPSTSKEARVILALEAIQNDRNLSLRAAAKLYNIPESTLRSRRAGILVRRDIPANLRKLTDLEEETIVQYVVELYTRVFPPRLGGIEDIANQLLYVRDVPPVGKLWAYNFVRRKEELRTRWTRRYDY